MNRALACVSLAAAFVVAACSAILDFELDPAPECWCGEEWRAELIGAKAVDVLDADYFPTAADTRTSRCVSQSQSHALAVANPNDPIYQQLAAELEAEVKSNCVNWALAELGQWLDYTTCEDGVVQIYHAGACWIEETEAQPCPAEQVCGRFYDCDDTPIVRWKGELVGETGDIDEPAWTCD